MEEDKATQREPVQDQPDSAPEQDLSDIAPEQDAPAAPDEIQPDAAPDEIQPDAAPDEIQPDAGPDTLPGQAVSATAPDTGSEQDGPDSISQQQGPDKKKRLLLLAAGVAAAALILFCCFWFAPSARYDRAFAQAEACMAAEDYEAALTCYTKALAAQETAEALLGQAAAYLNLDRPDQALACYERLLELEPADTVYAAMADVYLALGDYRQALSLLDQGIRETGSAQLQQQLEALLTQLDITNYTEAQIAASDNIWAIGAAEEVDTAAEEGDGGADDTIAIATDIDVVAVLDRESGLLTISRNGLDSDGLMADLARYGEDGSVTASYQPWREALAAAAAENESEAESTAAPLLRVEIKSGVVNIGAGAWAGCDLLTLSLGAEVERIGRDAFSGCTSLSQVELAEGSCLKELGASAFRNCVSLHDLPLPETVESLGDYCLNGSGLTQLTFPEALTYLGQKAVDDCSSLVTVKVNAALTDLGPTPFYGCSSLQNINVAENNPAYSSYDGVLYDKSCSTLLRCPEGRELCGFAPGVTAIGERAFYACAKLSGVELPGGLTSVGREAFAYCSRLSYVYLPASLASIGGRAFAYCASLASFALDNSSRNYYLQNGMLLSGDGATLVCCPMASATGQSSGVLRLPASVLTVMEGACVGCRMTGLICEKVTAIGAGAFAGCASLSSAVLPPTVTAIGAEAFSGSSDLVIYCQTGSYAESYAVSAGYRAETVSDLIMSMFY